MSGLKLRLGRSTSPYSRTFSTRPQSRRPRWRLRSQTQRPVAMALAFLVVLILVWLGLPPQSHLTVASSNFWLSAMGLAAKARLHSVELAGLIVDLPVIDAAIAPLDSRQFAWHLALLLPLIVLAHWLARRRPSAGWALGALCAIHLFGMVCAALGGPAQATLVDHSVALSLSTRLLLLITPLLGSGFILLEPSWSRRVVGITVLLAYLTLAEPLKLVLHAWLIQTAGPLSMPTLFIAFGPAFDVVTLAGILSSLLAVPPVPGESPSNPSNTSAPTV